MRAGRMRHRVAIQTATETADSYGEMVKTWATSKTVWGSIEPLSGSELIAAQQIRAESNIRVHMRYNSTVTPEHRLLFGTRLMEILAVINNREKNRELELLCKEVIE